MTRKYAVKGLLGGETLTISARDGGDGLGFEMGDLRWEAEGKEGGVEEMEGEVGCRVGEWVESGLINRVSFFFLFIFFMICLGRS